MDLYNLWTSLPAVITAYDADKQEASVLPLAKLRWVDNSQTQFQEIDNVPVICPSTAFAAIQFPIRKGDKVLLMFQSRDISWTLADMDTSGLDVPDFDKIKNDTGRMHELSDAVALIGFSSFVNPHGTSEDLHIFNNSDDSAKKNNIILQEDGGITSSTPNSSVVQDAGGNVSTTASGNVDVKAGGNVTIDASLTTINSETAINGNLTVTGNITATGIISATGVGGALNAHHPI